jgi:hypothetical protein
VDIYETTKYPRKATVKVNWMKHTKIAVLYALTLIVLIVAFILSLTLVNMLPNRQIKEHVYTDMMWQFIEEGGIRSNLYGSRKSVQDAFSDMLISSLHWYADPSRPFWSAMVLPTYPAVSRLVDNSTIYYFYDLEPTGAYGRYWHGEGVVLRPLLMALDLNGTRAFLTIVTMLMFVSVIVLIAWRINILVAAAFAVAISAAHILVIGNCWAYFGPFWVMFISSIFILLRFKDAAYVVKLPLRFFIIGCCTCFMDILTTPLIAFGIPAVLVFLIIDGGSAKCNSAKSNMVLFVKIGIAWISGYILTWVSKWVFTDLIFGTDFLSESIFKLSQRTGTDITGMRWKAFSYSVRMMFGTGWILVLTAIVIYFIIYGGMLGKLRRISAYLPFFGTAVLPYIYFLLLPNLVFIHIDLYPFRMQAITIFAIFAVMFSSFEKLSLANIFEHFISLKIAKKHISKNGQRKEI